MSSVLMLMYGRHHDRLVARGSQGCFLTSFPGIAALFAKQSAPSAHRASLVQAGWVGDPNVVGLLLIDARYAAFVRCGVTTVYAWPSGHRV